MSYPIIIAPLAQKQLRKLENSAFERITNAISRLGENPRPQGYKKLTGGTDEHRIRVGDYRVLYSLGFTKNNYLCFAQHSHWFF